MVDPGLSLRLQPWAAISERLRRINSQIQTDPLPMERQGAEGEGFLPFPLRSPPQLHNRCRMGSASTASDGTQSRLDERGKITRGLRTRALLKFWKGEGHCITMTYVLKPKSEFSRHWKSVNQFHGSRPTAIPPIPANSFEPPALIV